MFCRRLCDLLFFLSLFFTSSASLIPFHMSTKKKPAPIWSLDTASWARISFIIADVKKRVRVHPKEGHSDISLSRDVFDSCRGNQQSWRASGCAHACSLHQVTSNKTMLDFCSVEWKQATSQHVAICFCWGEHIQRELQAQMWRLWRQ